MRTNFGTWLRYLIGRVLGVGVRRQVRVFEACTHHAQEIQEVLLWRILHKQARTAFGCDHHFADIHTVHDFRRNVPVAPYEYHAPYIDRVRKGEISALLADSKVHMFALTSGTTAARKFIPVTEQYLTDYRRTWNIWGVRSYYEHPDARLRPIVQLSSDWQEFTTECGIPCGAVTGLTAAMQKRIVRWFYCVPAFVSKVKDAEAKNYLALRLSLHRHVSMLIAANPSTLVSLARAGDQQKESLIRDLYDGTLSPEFDIPGSVRAALAHTLSRRRCRCARRLEEIVRRTGTLYPRDYWPKNMLIGNWTGGSVGIYMRHYPRYFGSAPVRDIGLVASEGRMTIPFADGTPSGVLDIASHYFEFIPEEEADSEHPTVLGAHELNEGRSYYILLTTSYGLYRYHIHDLVRVTGFYNRTPLLEFLGKGSHFANITGEKLSEYHVTQAMSEVVRCANVTLSAYSLAPCWHEELPHYGLFVERGDLASVEQGVTLAEALDRHLMQANVEYAAKRNSQRLGPVRLELLPTHFWRDWDQRRLMRAGGAPEQYKHPCLISDLTFCESVDRHQDLVTFRESCTRP